MGDPIDCREAKERLTDYLKQELTRRAGGRGARAPGPLPQLLRPGEVRGDAGPAPRGPGPEGDLPRRLARADLRPAARGGGAELSAGALAAALAGSAAAALLAHRAGTLTRSGTVAAWMVGSAVLAGTGWQGGGVLAAFFVSSSLISRGAPAPRGLDPKGERRDHRQVLANGGVAAAAALVGLHDTPLGLWLLTGCARRGGSRYLGHRARGAERHRAAIAPRRPRGPAGHQRRRHPARHPGRSRRRARRRHGRRAPVRDLHPASGRGAGRFRWHGARLRARRRPRADFAAPGARSPVNGRDTAAGPRRSTREVSHGWTTTG